MTTIQALVIGATQGLTELAPISSLGHGVILPALFGWGEIEKDPSYLPFMVSLHLGTTLALLLYFHQEWRELLTGFFSFEKARTDPETRDARHVFILLLIGTIPAGLIGLLLEKKLRHLFSAPLIAVVFLAVNGFILILAEFLKKRSEGEGKIELADMAYSRGFFIGIFQAVALLPGISRSGMTMIGGLLGRLGHEEAARFSFLLSTPIIGAAGVLEVPKLIRYGSPQAMKMALIGGTMAFLMAWITTFLLMRYFRHFEANKALAPFGIYCILAGGVSWLLLR